MDKTEVYNNLTNEIESTNAIAQRMKKSWYVVYAALIELNVDNKVERIKIGRTENWKKK